MSPRNLFLIKGVAALSGLWLIVWGILHLTGGLQPTPEKIEAYIEEHPLSEINDPEARKETIGKIADMLNQLTPEQVAEASRKRREAGIDDRRQQREFFEQMNAGEQRYFMEKRVGKAFDQMMVAFNDMDRDERRRVVERTLRQMKDDKDGGGGFDQEDPEMTEKIVNEGLRAYYQEASAETKMDLAPVLEQMQKNLGRGKGRGPDGPQ